MGKAARPPGHKLHRGAPKVLASYICVASFSRTEEIVIVRDLSAKVAVFDRVPESTLGPLIIQAGSRLFVLQWIFSALEFSVDNNGRREGERERTAIGYVSPSFPLLHLSPLF